MNKASMQLWAITLCVHLSLYMHAQGVGIGTSTPQASAKLEVNSTTSGLLLPRMTFAQRNQIPAPAQALMVYCTDCGSVGEMQLFNGVSWTKFY